MNTVEKLINEVDNSSLLPHGSPNYDNLYRLYCMDAPMIYMLGEIADAIREQTRTIGELIDVIRYK